MKRRKRPDDPTVSLFPFLTVLICTIGMLIVLLVISVRQVGSKSQQIAAENAEKQRTELAELQADLDLHEIRAEGWTDIRESRVAELRAAHEERSYIEQALRELDDEAKTIAAQLQQLGAEAADDQAVKAEEKIVSQLRADLELEKKRLDEKKPLAEAPVMYNLVPYSGGGGTNRRPIYVECVNQKLILQPLGIELRVDDFVVPGEPGNPLDAGLTAIKEYWRRFDLAGEQGAPYPLLVVRPSGAQAYAVARRAMTSWVDEFGYELIPERKPIKFGTPDPQLAEEVRKAVEQARKNQALLAEQLQYRERVLQQRAIAKQMATGGGSGGLRADRARGGFTSDPRYASTHSQDGSGAAAVKKLLGSEEAKSELAGSGAGTGDQGGSGNSATSSPEKESAQFSLTRPANGGNAASNGSMERSESAADQKSEAQANSTYQPSNLTKPASAASSGNSSGQAGGAAAKSMNTSGKGEGGTAPLSSGTAPASLAESRGADWALPGKNTQRATAYLRPIRVICSDEELVIVTGPETPLAEKLIKFNQGTSSAVEPLVGSLWRLIDSWGPTPDNGYWKPVLKVETIPGGEHRARDLKALMQDSGIDFSEEEQ
ncbi:MAG: hypothetical protein ACKO81_12120 [Planctomycetota bacterium]